MKKLVLGVVLLSSLTSFANQDLLTDDEVRQLTIGSMEVHDVSDQYPASQIELDMAAGRFINPALAEEGILDTIKDKATGAVSGLIDSPLGQLQQVEFIVDKVINIGKKIWAVVELGRPVQNFQNQSASALPQNATRLEQLQNWQVPKSKVVSVVYKNLFGIEVVRFSYRVILLYGGDANGVGKYIGYTSVEPFEMTTSWGYTFNAQANVASVFNMGTSASPLAGMIMNVNWTVETVLKKTTVTHTFNLDGNGTIQASDNAGTPLLN